MNTAQDSFSDSQESLRSTMPQKLLQKKMMKKISKREQTMNTQMAHYIRLIRSTINESEKLIPKLQEIYHQNKSLVSIVAYSNDVKVWTIDYQLLSLLPVNYQNLIIQRIQLGLREYQGET